MNLPVHSVPPDVFDDLAECRASTDGLRLLIAAQRSKHALLLRHLVDVAQAARPEQAALTTAGYELLAEIQRADAQAAAAAMYHPPVGAWAARTLRGLSDAEPSADPRPGQLAAVAAAAAIRAGYPCTVQVPVIGGAVTLPSLGRLTVTDPASTASVTVDRAGVTITAGSQEAQIARADRPDAQAPSWQGLRTLASSHGDLAIKVLIEDVDDYRMPGSANSGSRLSAPEADRWQEVLTQGWQLLASHHRQFAVDVAAIATAFTPLTPPPGGHVSATSRETFGTVALSEPPDDCSLAVTLAHEIQHAKLSALIDIVPMTLPDDGSRHYAPWREDPRPIAGLLQGAYAFLGVAAFWRVQRELAADAGAHAEYVRWRASVTEVVHTLQACGRLTAAGEIFVGGMARTLKSWSGDEIPAEVARLAQSAADAHRSRWRSRNAEAAARLGR